MCHNVTFERSPRFGCPRIVLVNGRHDPDLSEITGMPSGIRVESLAAALRSRSEEIEPLLGSLAGFEDRAFTALNTASFEDGAVVTVAAGTAVETPIHVVHLSAPAGVAVSAQSIYFDGQWRPFDLSSATLLIAAVSYTVGARTVVIESESGFVHTP